MGVLTENELGDVWTKVVKPAIERHETLIVKSANEDSGVLMIPIDELASWEPTIHEMSVRANRERLEKSIRQLEEGKTIRFDINSI